MEQERMDRASRARRRAWTTSIATLALFGVSACQATGAGAQSDCYRSLAISVDIDLAGGTWDFEGFCIERLNPACAKLVNCSFKAGVDLDGDGRLSPNETFISYHEDSPGDRFCVGATQGHFGPEARGKNLLVDIQAHAEGQTKPLVSTTEKLDIEA